MTGAAGIPVAVQGLGPMGRVILAVAQRDPLLDIVAAVDIDPAMVGRPLGALGLAPERLPVSATLPPAPEGGVLLHATGSYLQTVAGQLEAALAGGWHVVSTCEELSYPFARHPALAATLDATARAAGRSQFQPTSATRAMRRGWWPRRSRPSAASTWLSPTPASAGGGACSTWG